MKRSPARKTSLLVHSETLTNESVVFTSIVAASLDNIAPGIPLKIGEPGINSTRFILTAFALQNVKAWGPGLDKALTKLNISLEVELGH